MDFTNTETGTLPPCLTTNSIVTARLASQGKAKRGTITLLQDIDCSSSRSLNTIQICLGISLSARSV